MNLNPIANTDKVQPADLDTGPVVVLNLLKFKPGDSLKTISRICSACLGCVRRCRAGGDLCRLSKRAVSRRHWRLGRSSISKISESPSLL